MSSNSNTSLFGFQYGRPFPDPFNDYASRVIPTNIRQAMRFCQGLFYYNPLVRETARRTLSVFVTEVELKGSDGNNLGQEERDKYKEFLEKQLFIYQRLQEILLDLLCYGNSYCSLYVPVTRSLYCGPCQENGRYVEFPARDVLRDPKYKFSWELPKFYAHCQTCKRRTQWGRVDRRSDGSDAVIRRYGTQEIDIRYDENRDYREYIWLIPNTYRRKVQRGDPQVLEAVPWEVVECVQTDSNMLFEPGYVYHMYEPTLSGLDHQGWGLPRALVNARPAFQYQVLNRQNEALSMDYVTPMRWITPDSRGGDGGEQNDPLASIDLGEFRGQIEDAVEKHRFDPATTHFSSYPLKYTVMGGEASQFAPAEMLNQSADMLLNAMGFPSSLFRGELDIKTALPAIRLFQSYWAPMVRQANGLVDWVLTRLGEERGWEPVTGSLISPTLIDDPQLIMAKLQLAQSGDFSKTDAVRALGANYKTQLEQQADEERMRAKIQEDLQREQEQKGMLANVAAQQQQAAQGQQAGAEGGGGGGGGETNIQGQGAGPVQNTGPILPNQNITPQQLLGMADAEAGKMLAMSDGERQSALASLKSKDPTLHMAVTASIKDKRRAAQQQGGAQVLQQQYGGGG